ncbi:MAG TPA: type II secretion system protein [Gemmatimonadales bacterium]|nr:type II secretion system protein [Gemmatimonadales bacterium]
MLRITRGGRAGLTLVELMIVVVLLGIVGAGIVSVMLRQQKFVRGTTDLIATRQQIREIAAVLPADLRGISSVGGDIYTMSDSAIEFRSTFGGSVVCVTNVAATWVSTPPITLVRGSTFTSWSGVPQTNDSVLIYDNGATTKAADDSWQRYALAAVAVQNGSATYCPTTSGLVQAADITPLNKMYQFLLTPAPLSATISVGAAIRFFRRVHYRLYQAADGNWYLGYFMCRNGQSPVCNAVQPIGGPFNAYASPAAGTSGVQFSYFDSTGTALDPTVAANRAAVARIRLVVRGTGQSLGSLSGMGFQTFKDSLMVDVGLRNRL